MGPENAVIFLIITSYSFKQSFEHHGRECAKNMFKDVSHIVKNCDDNFQDYQYEFLGVMEQLSLKNMVDAPNGQVLTLPILVRYH